MCLLGPLTPRELQVLAQITEGKQNKTIAKELWISEKTVEHHLYQIYQKLGVSNRTEAAITAITEGIIDTPK